MPHQRPGCGISRVMVWVLTLEIGNGPIGVLWSLPSHLDPGEGGGVDPGGGTTREEDLAGELDNAVKSDFGSLNYWYLIIFKF